MNIQNVNNIKIDVQCKDVVFDSVKSLALLRTRFRSEASGKSSEVIHTLRCGDAEKLLNCSFRVVGFLRVLYQLADWLVVFNKFAYNLSLNTITFATKSPQHTN